MDQDDLTTTKKKSPLRNSEICKRYTDRHHLEGGERNRTAEEKKKVVSKKRTKTNKAKREKMIENGEIDAYRAKIRAAVQKCREKQKNFPQVEYRQMKAIVPPSKSPVLEWLRDFDMYLQKNSTKVNEEFDKYEKLANSPVNIAGIRLINGDRYEVFVNDMAGKGTGIFDWLMGEVEKQRTKETVSIPKARLEQIRNDIIVFANKRAKRDERVSKDTIFKNHAFIISFGKCERQDVHIDLTERGHFQFGLLCTDNVFATEEYSPEEPLIGEDCNLADVWNDIPTSLAENLLKHPFTESLLKGFGSLLSVSESTRTEARFPIGTLLSLPASVPHAGPFSDKLRAVLFFTGNPPGGTPYSYDTQHSRTTLLSEIIMHNWVPLQKYENFAMHREYLLTKWDLIGLQNDKFALNNMHHRHLIKFAKDILKTKGDQRKKTDKIQALAKRQWNEAAWEEDQNKKSGTKRKGQQTKKKSNKKGPNVTHQS